MLSPFIRYTILRLLTFFACLLLMFAIPWVRENPLILVIAAALLSMLLSLYFFRGPRDEMSVKLAERIEHRTEHKQSAHARRGGAQLRDEAAEDAEMAADQERYR